MPIRRAVQVEILRIDRAIVDQPVLRRPEVLYPIVPLGPGSMITKRRNVDDPRDVGRSRRRAKPRRMAGSRSRLTAIRPQASSCRSRPGRPPGQVWLMRRRQVLNEFLPVHPLPARARACSFVSRSTSTPGGAADAESATASERCATLLALCLLSIPLRWNLTRQRACGRQTRSSVARPSEQGAERERLVTLWSFLAWRPRSGRNSLPSDDVRGEAWSRGAARA
jgi:hypothetical protein